MTVANAILQGIFLGAFYAVLACGLSLMFGVMRIINLAHGDVAVLGAYIVLVIVQSTGLSPLIAFVVALPAMIALASAGALTTESWNVFGSITIPALGLVVLAVAVVAFGALQVFLSRTRPGWRMRATAEDPDAAELIGIDSRNVYATATAIAVAIAGLGGLFLAIRSVFDPVSGPTQLIFAFEAVVIGGMGSLWGTLLGGLALGVAQTLGAQLNPEYAVLSGHLLFLAVLILRFGGVRLARFGARA